MLRACSQLIIRGSVPPNGQSFTWKKYVGSIVVSA